MKQIVKSPIRRRIKTRELIRDCTIIQFLVCYRCFKMLQVIRIGENSVRVSNSLKPVKTPSYSVCHPGPSCLNMAVGLIFIMISTSVQLYYCRQWQSRSQWQLYVTVTRISGQSLVGWKYSRREFRQMKYNQGVNGLLCPTCTRAGLDENISDLGTCKLFCLPRCSEKGRPV